MELYTSSYGYYGLVENRRIVKSGGFGFWTPEHVEELRENILSMAKTFDGKQWGYLADPSGMDPNISDDTSAAFSQLHTELSKAGCIAIAFLDGKTAPIRMLSQKHQNNSVNQMKVLHFTDETQALNWMKDLGV